MKNLTSKIVMALAVTVMGVASANAAVTSKDYVDRQDALKANHQGTGTAGVVATVDANGQYIRSTTALTDLATDAEVTTAITNNNNTYVTNAITDAIDGVTTDVNGKADKVEEATAGNLAGLDASGNLTDSGVAKSTIDGALTNITNIQGDITEIQGDITTIEGQITNLGNTYATDTELNTAITNEVTRADGKYEQLVNKVTAIDDTTGGSTTKYTSEKAVVDYVSAEVANVTTDLGDLTTTVEGNTTNITNITNTMATDTELADGLALKEDKTNKVSAIDDATGGSTDKYTSEKAVVDYVGAEVAGLDLQAISKVPAECSNPTNYCALTTNGTAFVWEVIER